VLYLGEISQRQEVVWREAAAAFPDAQPPPRTGALFAAERAREAQAAGQAVRVKLTEMALRRPRQYGAGWLACHLYQELGLDGFWAERLPPSRTGTRWDLVLQTLTAYRLIDPGSQWRLHHQWFEPSAMGDLLGCDFAALAEMHKLYRCHDLLLEHKATLFEPLSARWRELFNAQFEVLLYDLSSTSFESDPPLPEGDKRMFGHSRDKRPDCVPVVLAHIVTPEGFPLACEVMPGDTADQTTLKDFLAKIEQLYGKAQRLWVMNRGIPTEESLKQMRASDPPGFYVVGTPKGRLTHLEQKLAALPQAWECDLQLGRVEDAFRNLQGDLGLRPILHQDLARIEAHIFIAFLAYCLHVTLARRRRDLAPGLTPRSVLKLAAIPMLDVHLPDD
jgi:hypothetical protein